MPDYKAVDEDLEVAFEDVWEAHEKYLKPEVFEKLDDHLEEVKGYNRGRKSTAYTTRRSKPLSNSMSIRLQNDASFSVIAHELGHTLADAFGFDTTSEATERASNKTNYSRWPQFSFGKKDSPVERFMFRNYGALHNLTRHTVDPSMQEDLAKHADIFDIDGEYYETHTYQFTANNHEKKRFCDPTIQDDMLAMKHLSGDPTKDVSLSDDIKLIDRYELTPGLGDGSWTGFEKVMAEVNSPWHQAVLLVRKRGEKRKRGMMMSPQGKRKSYYVMNAHEYFAELHSTLLNEQTMGRDTNTRRLRKYCPDLVDAYMEHIIQ